jgi:hypothetical protein
MSEANSKTNRSGASPAEVWFPSNYKMASATNQSAASIRSLQVRKEDIEPSLLPLRVIPQYQKCGWFLFVMLLGLFISGSIALIVVRYEARKNPQVNSRVVKENNMKFPTSIKLCPEKSAGAITWHYLDLISTPNARVNGEFDLSLNSLKYLNFLDFDCVEVKFNASAIANSAAIEFAVVWKQKLQSYSDILLILDNDHANSSYVASGLYNSSKGATNNIDLTLERFSYLPSSPPGVSEQWNLNTATTSFNFYEIGSKAMPIPCKNTTSLGYTTGCSTEIEACVGSLDSFRGHGCAMMAMFYLTINSNLITLYEEVDPVNWVEILSNLGGYWVYVGAGFSLFFLCSEKRNARIYSI